MRRNISDKWRPGKEAHDAHSPQRTNYRYQQISSLVASPSYRMELTFLYRVCDSAFKLARNRHMRDYSSNIGGVRMDNAMIKWFVGYGPREAAISYLILVSSVRRESLPKFQFNET